MKFHHRSSPRTIFNQSNSMLITQTSMLKEIKHDSQVVKNSQDRRCAEVDEILPDGFGTKKGDGLHYMAYAMGRMPYLWGEDAENFRQERWLNNGIFQPESPFKFIAFHAGPRICLGKDFAYRQMKILSIALLRFFRFKLADDARKITYRTMFTLHIEGSLHLRAIGRTKS